MVTHLQPGKVLSQDAGPWAQLRVLPSVVTWYGCLHGCHSNERLFGLMQQRGHHCKGGWEWRGEEWPL